MKKMTSAELEQEWASLRSQSKVALYVHDGDRQVLIREVCASPAEAGGYVAKLIREGYKHVEAVVQ